MSSLSMPVVFVKTVKSMRVHNSSLVVLPRVRRDERGRRPRQTSARPCPQLEDTLPDGIAKTSNACGAARSVHQFRRRQPAAVDSEPGAGAEPLGRAHDDGAADVVKRVGHQRANREDRIGGREEDARRPGAAPDGFREDRRGRGGAAAAREKRGVRRQTATPSVTFHVRRAQRDTGMRFKRVSATRA
jgi:hypothetical protein